MKNLTLLFGLLWVIASYAQCPDCSPDLTCGAGATFPVICPEILPYATAGAYYETAMTFFLPSEVEDPSSGITATLNQVVIGSVVGLPFGLSYQPNSENGTYYPANGDNYGCAMICGTPLQPGLYEVTINVTVTAVAFGFEQVVNESFVLPINVVPGEGGNASFSYDNLNACESVTSVFEALIDGSPGITTYAWDFGNGNMSDQANPPAQTYSTPGAYTVTLETTIENYFFQSVSVSSFENNWSGDVEELIAAFSNPDPYFTLINGSGAVVYTSSTIDNATSGSWSGINVLLDNPPYSIQFWDEDNGPPLGSQDDAVGLVSLVIASGSQSLSNGGSTNGNATITLDVTNVFTNEEVVNVWPVPTAEFTYIEEISVLDFNDPELAYFEWYFNGELVQQGDQDSLVMTQPGVYSCFVINSYGCSATSADFVLCPVIDLTYDPAGFFFVPDGYASYTWYYNGLPISNQQSNLLIASDPGNYALTITTDYGCTVESNVVTVTVGINELDLVSIIWPNPADDQLNFELVEAASVKLYNAALQQVFVRDFIPGTHTVNVSQWAVGNYIMTVDSNKGTQVLKIVISR